MNDVQYIPALRYRALTRLYDPIVRATGRERTLKQALVHRAGIAAGHRVLDIGCGTGTLAPMLKREYPSAEVVGLDPDAAVLQLAWHKAQEVGIEVRFDLGDATSLPYADSTYDRALCSLVFHHLLRPDKRSALSELRRVLRHGGELHIADWGKPQNWIMRGAFFAVQFLDGFATIQDNVEGLLPKLIEEAGFADVATTISFTSLFGTVSLYRGTKR